MNLRLPAEYAINMFCSNMMMLQESDIDVAIEDGYLDKNFPFHIYMIGKRKKITISRESKILEDSINLVFNLHNNENTEELLVNIPLVEKGVYELDIKYPFNSFILKKDGEIYGDYKTSLFLQQYSHFISQEKDFLDLEIIYIGQSYGSGGGRKAIDRLKSHSTLQKINSEIMTREPDAEIFILLCKFEPIVISLYDGRHSYTKEQLEENEKNFINRFRKINFAGITESQQINFVEASLIKYFSPFYNKIYKSNFPDKSHKTYSECYDLDINSVSFEIHSKQFLNCLIYSENIKKEEIILSHFLLNSEEERKSFFDI